jgi:hypothetical protein
MSVGGSGIVLVRALIIESVDDRMIVFFIDDYEG